MEQYEKKVLSVTDITSYLTSKIRNDPLLSFVTVQGEISNFTHHSTGHLYFSLKDEQSVIRCVMFRTQAQQLNFQPQNGMKVLVKGHLDLYAQQGSYQIVLSKMVKDGLGDLYIQFEELKKRLEQEGLFRDEHKKAIPRFPRKIGIITSPTGAAIQDLLNVLGRRYPLAEIELYPALVQGTEAAQSMIKGIDWFNRHPVDVLIIGRGGGAYEDLFCFNDEALARAIYDTPIPVISAVGHEIDFTISDFVADLRAPTPSAAAEIAVPNIEDLREQLLEYNSRIQFSFNKILHIKKESLNHFASSYVLKYKDRLFESYHMQVSAELDRLTTSWNRIFDSKKHQFELLIGKLDTLSPLKVLSRGYAVVKKEDGTAIDSVQHVKMGDQVSLSLHDGTLKAMIQEIEE